MLTTLLCVLLGSSNFHQRHAATEVLTVHGDPLLMAIVEAMTADPEVAMRLGMAGSAWRGLRAHHMLRSLEGWPFLDANPTWTHSEEGRRCLARAVNDLTVIGLAYGSPAGWPEYRLATRYWVEGGGEVWALGVMATRTERYMRENTFGPWPPENNP